MQAGQQARLSLWPMLPGPPHTSLPPATQNACACRCSQRWGTFLPPCPASCPAPPAADAFSSLVRQASAHPGKDMVPAPDLDRHVFCRVLEDRGNVTVDEEG